jgi:hypothetical protein
MVPPSRMYVVTFQTGRRVLQLHCRRFGVSDVQGLFEVAEIVFSESKILLHDEEALKSEFKDVERVLLPWSAILRVDEMKLEYRATEGPKLLADDAQPHGAVVIDFKRKGD